MMNITLPIDNPGALGATNVVAGVSGGATWSSSKDEIGGGVGGLVSDFPHEGQKAELSGRVTPQYRQNMTLLR
jgi:hypothetical protein